MALRVSGKNIAIGEALRQRVSARIGEALEKYFDGGYSGHVTVDKDGFGFRTECALHLDSGMTLEAKAVAADAYASVIPESRCKAHSVRNPNPSLSTVTCPE